jgi:hypothetical protein
VQLRFDKHDPIEQLLDDTISLLPIGVVNGRNLCLGVLVYGILGIGGRSGTLSD